MLGEWRNGRGAGPVIACKCLWGEELSRVGGWDPDTGFGDAHAGMVPGTNGSRPAVVATPGGRFPVHNSARRGRLRLHMDRPARVRFLKAQVEILRRPGTWTATEIWTSGTLPDSSRAGSCTSPRLDHRHDCRRSAGSPWTAGPWRKRQRPRPCCSRSRAQGRAHRRLGRGTPPPGTR